MEVSGANNAMKNNPGEYEALLSKECNGKFWFAYYTDFLNCVRSLIEPPAFISYPIVFIDPLFSSRDKEGAIESITIRVLRKKIDFSTYYFKKVDNNTPGTPNSLTLFLLMFTSSLLSWKFIAIWLTVKLRLIVKLKKSKKTKSTKNHLMKKHVFYILVYYSTAEWYNYDRYLSPEENEGSMKTIG